MDHRARLIRGMAREKETKKEKEVQTEMIEIAEKQMTYGEWMKAERAVSLTNEQILGLKGFVEMAQKRWDEDRDTICRMASERNNDGSLKHPKATKVIADLDEIEYNARTAVNRLMKEVKGDNQ